MRLIDADKLIWLVNDSTLLNDGFKRAFCAIVNGEPTVETEPMWTFCDDEPPKKPGKYLTYRYNNPYGFYKVVGFADDLYKIDESDFCDRKGKPGWYLYDSEYGFFELDVDAWMELPEPPERITNE